MTHIDDYLQNGCDKAFNQIYHRYDRKLRGVAVNYGTPADNLDDIMQDVWLKILRYLPTYDPEKGASFYTWSTTMCIQVVLNWRRQRARSVVETWEDSRLSLLHDRDDVESRIDNNRRLASAKQVIEGLPERRREVITLISTGTPFKEVSRQLGIPNGTVKSSAHRARRAIIKADPEGGVVW